MKWIFVYLLLGAAPAAPPQEPFGLIIACKKGGVSPRGESHLASGYICVLKDKDGGTTSAESLSVYDDGLSPGP